MNDARTTTDDPQAARWNGPAGHAWVEAQAMVDAMFKPLENLLVEAVSAAPEGTAPEGGVLDVGCGTGGTTVAAWRRLGPQRRCVGVDVSEPMIAAARARAERDGARADFVLADAQVHAFEPASFSVIMSRFGVMFFSDFVEAFTHLRRAATKNGALRFLAWRGPAENPFMTTAERAAAPLLPNLPARDPDGPGQFALAEPSRVRRILADSGWADLDLEPVDVVCSFPASELVRYFTTFGPLGQVLPEADERTRARVVEAVRAGFDPFVAGEDVHFIAACWMVGARASA